MKWNADDLYRQYLELGTLQKVGDAQDPPICRERVRQILAKAGYTKRNSHKIYTDEELRERKLAKAKDKYWANPEESRRKGREYLRKWVAKNPEKAKGYNRQRYLKIGKEENTRQAREYLARNREKVYARMSIWRKANPEKQRQYAKTWLDKNPQKREEYNRKKRERYARDKAATNGHS